MKLLIPLLTVLVTAVSTLAAVPWSFRPPAVPLVTHDPYWSIWSMSDRLTDSWPAHWTGTTNAICGLARIDGKTHRFLGPQPTGVKEVPALEQTDLKITPTRSIATFKGAGIELVVTFCSPLLPDKLDVLARPVTYVTTEARSADNKPHNVQVYLDICSEVAVNSTDQTVDCERIESAEQKQSSGRGGDPAILRTGSHSQPTLGRAGDRVRIDWGSAYLAAQGTQSPHTTIGLADDVRRQFIANGELPKPAEIHSHPVHQGWPVLAASYDLHLANNASAQSRHFMLAYDEDYAIEYMGKPLRPYWRKSIPNVEQLLSKADSEYPQIIKDCAKFDDSLMADLTSAGGEKYAQLCALAYREALAGHGLALSEDGQPFMFVKENSSNGCIGTVDVMYPAAPVLLLLSPELMKANLVPVIEYADSPRWKFPFAPHDLGTYPLANGQVYGGGEKTADNQMPVEETANLMILIDAMEHANGKGSDLASKHRKLLAKWANYLAAKGLDPENQLCTDDFTGHLAHNVNLSAKAIVALGAYAQICDRMKDESTAHRYAAAAARMAKQWARMADDGDHTRLAFDKPGTWSQKYNLVWDKVLKLNLFPKEILQDEVDYYIKKFNKYGPPLDNRAKFTKLDWTLWSACLGDNEADFKKFAEPVWLFANETPDRIPLTDWYQTDTGKVQGFQARPVVGGVFMKMLCDEQMWQKWAKN
jgi:hypothetical protein